MGFRARGYHVYDHSKAAAAEFFDYWHGEIAPTYRFALSASSADLITDVKVIRDGIAHQSGR